MAINKRGPYSPPTDDSNLTPFTVSSRWKMTYTEGADEGADRDIDWRYVERNITG